MTDRLKKRGRFARNAALLSASSIGLNLIGMAFRVYLSSLMGADGMGLYTLILSVYFFASTLASSGLSLSVTRLVSEAEARQRTEGDILRRTFALAVLLGTGAAALLLFFSRSLGLLLLRDARTVRPLQFYAVGLPFLGISACLGGYFLAARRIGDSVKWSFFEQGIKMLLTVLLLRFVTAGDLEAACCGVVIASVAGDLLACAYGFLLYLRAPKGSCARSAPGALSGFWGEIARIALPVATGAYFRSALSTLENVLIPRSLSRLHGGGLAEFGLLKGMAMPVVLFPSTVPSAFCSLLIPEISEAAAKGEQKKIDRLCGLALRGAFIYSIFSSALFFLFGKPLGTALYGDPRAGRLISLLSCAVPMLYLDAVSDSLLKALGQQVASLRYNTLEGVSRILLLIVLLPLYGAEGFILVILLSNALSAFSAIFRLRRITDLSLRPADSLLKPAVACLPASVTSLWISAHFSAAAAQAAAGCLSFALLFLLFLSLSGCADLFSLSSFSRFRKNPPSGKIRDSGII